MNEPVEGKWARFLYFILPDFLDPTKSGWLRNVKRF
jgi:hypothetical protein